MPVSMDRIDHLFELMDAEASTTKICRAVFQEMISATIEKLVTEMRKEGAGATAEEDFRKYGEKARNVLDRMTPTVVAKAADLCKKIYSERLTEHEVDLLISVYSNDELRDVLVERLPQIGVETAAEMNRVVMTALDEFDFHELMKGEDPLDTSGKPQALQ